MSMKLFLLTLLAQLAFVQASNAGGLTEALASFEHDLGETLLCGDVPDSTGTDELNPPAKPVCTSNLSGAIQRVQMSLYEPPEAVSKLEPIAQATQVLADGLLRYFEWSVTQVSPELFE